MKTTPLVPSLIDDQLADIERSLVILGCQVPVAVLPESMAVPEDRVLMVFKGRTMWEALQEAAKSHIENPEAWSRRACLCGEWTLVYEAKA